MLVMIKSIDCNWLLKTEKETFKIDYLVNSAGYKNTELEEVLDIQEDKHVEFKASYISKWKSPHGLIPEIIIHGERGTPHGIGSTYSGIMKTTIKFME